MYTHVIFDLDGTLLNTIDDLTDAGNHVCAAHGWPTHTVDEFKYMVGNGIPNLVSRFTPNGLGEEELAGVLAEFSAYYDAHKQDKTAPYPGVPELLAELKQQGVHLAVLSNKAHAMAGPVVEHYFPGVFEYVQGALPDVPLKPDPTLLRAMMEKIGAEPGTTLFVGDSDVDVRTGKNGGLTVCGVLWGFRDRLELELAGADYVMERPEQLLSGGKAMSREGAKKAPGVIGCAVCWLAVAFFAFFGWAVTAWVWELLLDLIVYGYDDVVGGNLRLAEDLWVARIFMLLFGIPFVLMLVLAIRSTAAMRKAMSRESAKNTLGVIGCVACWLAAAFFAFLEGAAALWVLKLLPDVINFGYDEAAGYNLYLAEDFWEARICMLLFGIPLVFMLVLAIRSTMKLIRQGKKHEHPTTDPW